jgi:hypothetical protein
MKTRTQDLVSAEIIGTDLSGNLTSEVIPLDQIYGFAAIYSKTGTAAGTLKAQVSNQNVSKASQVDASAGWIDLPSASQAIASGAETKGFQSDAVYYKWLRFVFTFTAGTGTLTALNITTKGP